MFNCVTINLCCDTSKLFADAKCVLETEWYRFTVSNLVSCVAYVVELGFFSKRQWKA